MEKEHLIVFLCTGNTCRSPMAAALFEKLLSDRRKTGYTVKSCGLAAFAGDTATEHSIEVMRENGIDLSGHRASPANILLLDGAELIVCMTEAHKNALIKAGISPEKITVMNIPDPFGGTLDDYRECAEKIKTELVKIYEKLD